MRSAKQAQSASLALALTASVLAVALSACDKESPRPPPPPPAAAPPAAPSPAAGAAAADAGSAKPKMVANPDGLSLAERIAKRQAAEAKVAAELAAAEKERLLAYDRTKLPLHKQTFAFIQKTRAQYDAVARKGPGAKAELDKLRGTLAAPIAAAAKKMASIDPKGGNSNVTTDYDVMLNALANDYPAAIAISFEGDQGPLGEQTAELDRRTRKIEDWLTELGSGGKGNGKSKAGESKAGKAGKKKKR
ncbi:MAG TPA: hypothetical protein VFH68_26705 [Polyangia bacterium]|nr:hypothetical protein [Polyangia bacterium]